MVRPRFGLVLCLLVMVIGDLALGQDLARGWAWAGIATTTLENQGKPQPAPTPAPGQVCQTCNGSGKVGDGRVFQTCRDCNGTGKVATQAKKASPQQQPAALQRFSSEQVICEGGVCYPVPQVQQQRYQTRQPARVIMRERGFFFRR